WAKIQQKTFTNWCNDNLKESGTTVQDLAKDLEDGIVLIKLVETLSGRKVGRYHRKVKNKPQKLENVAKALKAIANDTVQLVNIGNEDIVNGNLKLILGLIWRLILTYQIKVKTDSSDKHKASAKSLMMTWIQSIMPACRVRNLNKDWNTGIPLCALVDHIQPGVCPQWTSLDSRNRLNNARLGMNIAEEKLGVPQVLSPEDLISPELDDLSMLTYLSYFTSTQESPGYQEVLKFVNSHLPEELNVGNFSTDWKDGKVLHEFVNAI
ncbi:uncharacterized protein TRIADDRAFT_3330, partial [Trichoplax adhaerens]